MNSNFKINVIVFKNRNISNSNQKIKSKLSVSNCKPLEGKY